MSDVHPGAIFRVGPYHRYNNSPQAHYFVILEVDDAFVLWVPFSSVKDDGRPYDNTCVITLPRRISRGTTQSYVRYDHASLTNDAIVSRCKYIVDLPHAEFDRVMEGVHESGNTHDDVLDFLRDIGGPVYDV